VQVKLVEVKTVLERRIGVSLDEIDEYLHAYKFGPETLLAMVGYFLEEGDPDQRAFEEIAGEIDGFLWTYSETGTINPDTFLALFEVSRSLCPLACNPYTVLGVLFEVFLCVHRLDHLSAKASDHIVHQNFLIVGSVLRTCYNPIAAKTLAQTSTSELSCAISSKSFLPVHCLNHSSVIASSLHNVHLNFIRLGADVRCLW